VPPIYVLTTTTGCMYSGIIMKMIMLFTTNILKTGTGVKSFARIVIQRGTFYSQIVSVIRKTICIALVLF